MPTIIHRIRPGWPSYLTQERLRKLRMDYCIQRSTAGTRGVRFTLSFGEWLGIWIASGKVLKRGRHRGDYVMARIGDQGAYRVGNVEIILHADNVRQFHLGKVAVSYTHLRASDTKF